MNTWKTAVWIFISLPLSAIGAEIPKEIAEATAHIRDRLKTLHTGHLEVLDKLRAAGKTSEIHLKDPLSLSYPAHLLKPLKPSLLDSLRTDEEEESTTTKTTVPLQSLQAIYQQFTERLTNETVQKQADQVVSRCGETPSSQKFLIRTVLEKFLVLLPESFERLFTLKKFSNLMNKSFSEYIKTLHTKIPSLEIAEDTPFQEFYESWKVLLSLPLIEPEEAIQSPEEAAPIQQEELEAETFAALPASLSLSPSHALRHARRQRTQSNQRHRVRRADSVEPVDTSFSARTSQIIFARQESIPPSSSLQEVSFSCRLHRKTIDEEDVRKPLCFTVEERQFHFEQPEIETSELPRSEIETTPSAGRENEIVPLNARSITSRPQAFQPQPVDQIQERPRQQVQHRLNHHQNLGEFARNQDASSSALSNSTGESTAGTEGSSVSAGTSSMFTQPESLAEPPARLSEARSRRSTSFSDLATALASSKAQDSSLAGPESLLETETGPISRRHSRNDFRDEDVLLEQPKVEAQQPVQTDDAPEIEQQQDSRAQASEKAPTHPNTSDDASDEKTVDVPEDAENSSSLPNLYRKVQQKKPQFSVQTIAYRGSEFLKQDERLAFSTANFWTN